MFSGGSTHISPRLWPHITILALWAEAGLLYLIWLDIYTLCSFTKHLPFLPSLSIHLISLHIFVLSSSKSPFAFTLDRAALTLPFFIFAVIFLLEERKHNNWSVLSTAFPSSHPPSYYSSLVTFIPNALLPIFPSLIISSLPYRHWTTNYHCASPSSY